MVKLQQNKGGQFWLTIPREYAKLKGWVKGTELVFGVNDRGDLVLKEVKP